MPVELPRHEPRSLSYGDPFEHAPGVHCEHLEKRRPVGLIRLIGNRTIGIQHRHDRAPPPNRPRGGLACLAVAREVRQRVFAFQSNTFAGTNGLSHWSGFAQRDVEPRRVRREIKPDGSPVRSLSPLTRKTAARLGLRPLDKALEHFAEGGGLIERANVGGQSRRLRGPLVFQTKPLAQLAQLSRAASEFRRAASMSRSVASTSSRVASSSCRADSSSKAAVVRLLASGLGSLSGGLGLFVPCRCRPAASIWSWFSSIRRSISSMSRWRSSRVSFETPLQVLDFGRELCALLLGIARCCLANFGDLAVSVLTHLGLGALGCFGTMCE